MMFRRAGDALIPLKRALTVKERIAVSMVPGAQVDEETGETRGADHTVYAVAKVFGCKGAPRAAPGGYTSAFHKGFKKLSPYQLGGVAHLWNQLQNGALCHDDVGLGKTPQAIAALTGSDLVKLVLVPAYLRSQWRGEIKRWTNEFRSGAPENVHVLNPETKKTKTIEPKKGDWIVAFYRDATAAYDLIGAQDYALVVDEVHNLRTLTAQQTEEVSGIATWASARIGLTGDVLTNNVAKLYPVLNIVQPGAFGATPFEFNRRYCGAFEDPSSGHWKLGKPSSEGLTELKERMAFFAYRRTWDDVPEKERPFETRMQTVWVKCSRGHSALRSLMAKGIDTVRYAAALADAKMEAVCDAVLNDARAGIPSLTFTHLKKHAVELREVVKEGLVVTGDTYPNPDKRLPAIEAYVKECALRKKTPMVFGDYAAIGEGANLQWAKVVNFAAMPFGSDVIRQAFARAARRGNTGTIVGRLFVARGTADEYLINLVKEKLAVQLKLTGKEETAKVSILNALNFGMEEVKAVMQQMLEDARRAEEK